MMENIFLEKMRYRTWREYFFKKGIENYRIFFGKNEVWRDVFFNEVQKMMERKKEIQGIENVMFIYIFFFY